MTSGQVHYVPASGTLGVRRAIREKVRRRNGINADINETIFITTKLAVYASLFAVTEMGYSLHSRSGLFLLRAGDPVGWHSDPI